MSPHLNIIVTNVNLMRDFMSCFFWDLASGGELARICPSELTDQDFAVS